MEEKICCSCFSPLNTAGPCPNCSYDPAQDEGKYPLALKTGAILNGRYIIGRVLGQGGFGITYIAQDVQTNEKVAIKEYFPETMATRTGSHSVTAFSGTRQENFGYGMQCFLSEAQTLAQFIGTENIVRVHSYFEENGTAYFVMDYVDGVSFQTYLKQKGGKISWEEATALLFPIMDALSVVHSKGIIHRDISPDNIYITKDGKVKLLDFGAARYSLGDRSRSLDVVLKAGYAPMEQYTRRGRQGPYTDVYAMAATFYFAISGRLPPESVERVEEDLLVLPSSYGVRLPEAAEDALEKALAVRATERWQSMEEFRRALCAEGGGEPTVKVSDPVIQVHEQTTQTEQNHAAESHHSDTKKEIVKLPGFLTNLLADRKRLLTLAAAAAAILVFVVIYSGIPAAKYNKACKALDDKKYDEAYSAFLELENFRDSRDLAKESLYQKANDLLKHKDYDSAYRLFLNLGRYEDSEDLALEARYQKAEHLLKEQSFDEALQIFQELENYEDSEDMVTEVLYQKACHLLEDKSYKAAYAMFQELKDYRDSKDQLTNCIYRWTDAVLDGNSALNASDFLETVSLNSSHYDTVYSKILSHIDEHDTLRSWASGILSSPWSTTPVKLKGSSKVSCVYDMLQSLPSSHKDTGAVTKLFKYMSDGTMDNAGTFIRGNKTFLKSVWDLDFVQDYLTNDNNIYYFMEGNWRTDNNSYRLDFTKNADGSTQSYFTLPWVAKPAGTAYYSFDNLTMSWVDKDYKELAKLFRFTILGFDRISVYCYKNSQTYQLSR